MSHVVPNLLININSFRIYPQYSKIKIKIEHIHKLINSIILEIYSKIYLFILNSPKTIKIF